MSIVSQGLNLLEGLFANRVTLAALTFGGMVLTVLGAFSIIDAVRLPPKLGRTGMPLVTEFDETVIVRGIPRQVMRESGVGQRVVEGIVSGAIGALAFAIVVSLGYRQATVGAAVGSALGLGLGLAVALRPAIRWLTRQAGLSLLFIFLRSTVSFVSAIAGQAILFLFAILLFLIVFVLIVAIWLVLLPWLLFAWVVRRIRNRPLHTTALLAPFTFPLVLRETTTKAQQTSEWKDPSNTAANARFARWAVGQLPKLQKLALGLVIGNLYAIAGQPLIAGALRASGDWWLLLGTLVLFGFVVERIFEVVVESLFFLDIAKFADQGPSTLNELRVGLVSGLALGTIAGLVTSGSSLTYSISDMISSLTSQGVAAAVAVGAFAALLALMQNLLGFFLGIVATPFTNWMVDRVGQFRIGTVVGGAILLLTGTALQLIQYVITAH